MGWRRRRLLGLAAVVVAIPGCGSDGLSAPATPPPNAFEVTLDGPHAIVLRYTGIGGQSTDRFRVVLEGAGDADGPYDLAAVSDDDRWTDEDAYRLNQSTLGLQEPLAVEGLVLELQYDDDGTWRTLRRLRPAD